MAARKTRPAAITLKRRDVVTRVLSRRGDAAVVTGIGNAVHDVASCGDDARNMYLAGIMGGASMVAFGVALAQPQRRVLVITGDGELLAGIGEVRARRIIDSRASEGPFAAPEEVVERNLVTRSIFEQIRDRLIATRP